jgi:hypothetical protein
MILIMQHMHMHKWLPYFIYVYNQFQYLIYMPDNSTSYNKVVGKFFTCIFQVSYKILTK